jgi:hypothetical protein
MTWLTYIFPFKLNLRTRSLLHQIRHMDQTLIMVRFWSACWHMDQTLHGAASYCIFLNFEVYICCISLLYISSMYIWLYLHSFMASAPSDRHARRMITVTELQRIYRRNINKNVMRDQNLATTVNKLQVRWPLLSCRELSNKNVRK